MHFLAIVWHGSCVFFSAVLAFRHNWVRGNGALSVLAGPTFGETGGNSETGGIGEIGGNSGTTVRRW